MFIQNLHRNLITFISFFVLLFFVLISCKSETVAPKDSSEDQLEVLNRRIGANSLFGSFDNYSSYLYAFYKITLMTNIKSIGKIELSSPFPKFYNPSVREILNTIGRQTNTSWQYDKKNNYWLFSKPAKPMPYDLEIADGWISQNRGMYVFYKPPIAPVGMDVYIMGSYSSNKNENDLFRKVRQEVALKYARPFYRDVTVDDMSITMVGKHNALFFKTKSPVNDVIWRQWVIVEKGIAFCIVSAVLPEHEERILADVKNMLKTFRINKKQATL